MAFDISGFNFTRGPLGATATPSTNSVHVYISSADTVATILGVAYFPANFGILSGLVKTGDFIKVKGTDGTGEALVTNAATGAVSNISPAVFSSTTTTQNINFSGPWASPQATTLTYVRNDYGSYSIVTVSYPQIFANATVSASVTADVTSLYIPSNAVGFSLAAFPIIAVDNNAYTAASLEISSVGTIEIHKVPGNVFSGLSISGGTGWSDAYISFIST